MPPSFCRTAPSPGTVLVVVGAAVEVVVSSSEVAAGSDTVALSPSVDRITGSFGLGCHNGGGCAVKGAWTL